MEKSDQKILVVEDDPSLLEIVSLKLKKEGFQIVSAEDGEEALRVAFAERPDLILLDILMPKLDGLEVLRRLRQDSWGKYVPIIILSNVDSVEMLEGTLGKGAFDYLIKSEWNLNNLVHKIEEHLNCQ